MKNLTLKQRFKLDRFLLGERILTHQPLTLTQQRIFILPTARGFGFVVLLILLVLIAFVYNNNLAYLLAFLLASVFFITILHTYRTLSGLTVQEGAVIPVFAGEVVGFTVIVDNPTAIERVCLQATMRETTETFALAPQSKTQLTLYEVTQRRGWHSASTITVSSTYPLGLFRAWSPLRFNAKVLVYPKPASQSIAFPDATANNEQSGATLKNGDEFYGLRSYQAGDPIKHLHWKTYAKGLGLFSKQYGGEQSTEIWLDYHSAPGASVEERLSILCRWVLDAEQAHVSYGLILPNLRLIPAQGDLHYRQCLEALALF